MGTARIYICVALVATLLSGCAVETETPPGQTYMSSNGKPDCCEMARPSPRSEISESTEKAVKIDTCVDNSCSHSPGDNPLCCNGPNDCDDQNECTEDVCNPQQGCENIPDPGLGPDCCSSHGDCGPGGIHDDGDPSTIDYCTDAHCQHVANPNYCDDSGNHPCLDEGKLCTDDLCVDNVCQHIALEGCCENDSHCDDGDQCTVDTCNANQCEYAPVSYQDCCRNSGECRDPMNPCSLTDTCEFHSGEWHCVDQVDPENPNCCNEDTDCPDDGCSCTIESCNQDGHFCESSLDEPDCCFTDQDCDDGNEFTSDTCDGCQCTHAASATCNDINDPCDDGRICTTDSCDIQQLICSHQKVPNCCTAGTDCRDELPCTKDECQTETDSCYHSDIPNCCEVDAECDDENPCTADLYIMMECRHVQLSDCCANNNDCQSPNDCWQGSCDTQQSKCIWTLGEGTGCCNTPADCWDGTPCAEYACNAHTCEITSQGCECTVDAECDDSNVCTYDACQDNICHHIPADQAPPEVEIPPLCCNDDIDCDDDGDPCTNQVCTAGLCQFVNTPTCVMDLPYIEKFSSCGTLEYCHWQILDGPLAQTSNDNWQISTGETWDSPLGPDLHALFRWIPVISSLDSYLVSPRLNLAGSETVTVQYDFFLDWYQDDITFGTRWGGTGTDFINESVSLNEQIYNIDVEAGLVHVTTETTDPDTQVGFHLAAASSGGIELLGLDEIRVCAGSPPLFVNVPEE